MTSRPRGLGRGLGALIPATVAQSSTMAGQQDDVAAAPEGGTDAAALRPSARHLTAPDPVAASSARMRQLAVIGQRPGAETPPGSAEDTDGDDARQVTAVGDRMSTPSAVPGAYFAEIPIDAISPNPLQPREVFDEDALEELVQSISEVGLLQPIVVRSRGVGHYELVMGERRWRACRDAGLAAIPAIVRETDDDRMLLDALLENLHRAQLNPLEEAAAYEQLLREFGCTHEQLADRIGRSRSQVSNTIRLLKLSAPVQRRVAAGVLSAGHARALLSMDDPEQQDRLAYRIVAEGLSVRAVEEIVALGEKSKPVRRPRAGRRLNPGLAELASRLSDHFETRVKVDLGQKRGKIVIEFASVDDLERIISSMSPQDGNVLRVAARAADADRDAAAAESPEAV